MALLAYESNTNKFDGNAVIYSDDKLHLGEDSVQKHRVSILAL